MKSTEERLTELERRVGVLILLKEKNYTAVTEGDDTEGIAALVGEIREAARSIRAETSL